MTVAAVPGPLLTRLDNGVTLICDPVPGFETLALSVVVGRGARWELPEHSGWSHLLEHMVFKGAGSRHARDIVESIEAAGGQLNAATGHERTSFQVRALRGGLPLALEIIGDLVNRPHLAFDDLAREKQVVGQEIAEAADTPDDQVFELAQSAAFADQPLGRPILGSVSTIAAATPETLGSWRAQLYGPDRIVISAAGALDPAELRELAERHFADAVPAAHAPPPPASFTGGHVEERRKLEQAHLVFLLPAPGAQDPLYWALRVFAEALGGGMSSRLFQEAREKLGLAYAIDSYAETYSDVGVLGIYAGCDPADAPRLAEVAAKQVLDLLCEITPSELARSKAQLKASLFMGRESLLARAEQAAAQLLITGEILSTADLAAAIDSVDPSDIRRLSASILGPRRSTVSVLGPRKAMQAASRFDGALFR